MLQKAWRGKNAQLKLFVEMATMSLLPFWLNCKHYVPSCTRSGQSFATCSTVVYRKEARFHKMIWSRGYEYTGFWWGVFSSSFSLSAAHERKKYTDAMKETERQRYCKAWLMLLCGSWKTSLTGCDRAWDITLITWTRGRVWQAESWKKLNADRLLMNLIEMLTSLLTTL